MKKVKKKLNKKEEQTKGVRLDAPLFEYIQPHGGVYFYEPGYILTGDGYIKVIHIYRLPQSLSDHWMDSIFDINGTISTVDVHTKDTAEVKKNINRSLQEQYSRERNATDFAEVYDARKRRQELEAMYNEISQMGEVIKTLHFRIFVPGRSLVDLEERVGLIMKNLESDGFIPTILLNEGKREWQSLFKSFTEQHKEPFYIKGQPLTTEQIATGNPFHYSELLDDNGTFLGFTPCGGVVSFDLWEKSLTRRYYNALVCGDLGAGKSTFLKKLFTANASDGNFIRTFDASGEFEKLTYEFGGKLIKGNGENGILNPLEILEAGETDYDSFTRHITKFKTFFSCLRPSVTDDILIELENLLNAFYETLDLTPKRGRQITGLPAGKYPTLSDFWKFCKDEIEERIQGKDTGLRYELAREELLTLSKIEKVLSSLVKNYGHMFDGITTIDNLVDEKLVTFDISGIRKLGNVFAAQMYLITSLCWDNAIRNGIPMKKLFESGVPAWIITKFLILIDEAHEWINTKMPVLLEPMTKYLREARKFFAGIVPASQTVRDFNPEGENSSYFDQLKTFFELTQYKFMFRQNSSVLPVLNKLFGNELTFAQIKQIPFLKTGETVLSIAGDKGIRFKVWMSEQYEAPIFSGGR